MNSYSYRIACWLPIPICHWFPIYPLRIIVCIYAYMQNPKEILPISRVFIYSIEYNPYVQTRIKYKQNTYIIYAFDLYIRIVMDINLNVMYVLILNMRMHLYSITYKLIYNTCNTHVKSTQPPLNAHTNACKNAHHLT